MTIRVLIVDDQKFIRQALQALLAEDSVIEVVGEASDGEMGIRQVETLQPDVVLMDIQMPKMDGVEATKYIHQHFKTVKILILSIDDDDISIIHALQNGAAGYILRTNIVAEQLCLAIQVVYRDNIYLSPEIGKIVIAQLTARTYQRPLFWEKLTPSQQKVASLVADGLTNLEIAKTLFIAEATVKNHITNILARLDLQNRIQLALLVNRNLVTPIAIETD